MKLLVTGATGYIGRVIAARLLDAGHAVVAAVRPTSDRTLLPRGATTVVAGLDDPAALGRAARETDGVVHLAHSGGLAADTAVLDAYQAAFAGRRGALLWTTGIWVLGRTTGAPATETSPTAPITLVRERAEVERAVLAAAGPHLRAVVVRPGIVHGRGAGIPAMLVEQAAARGTGVVVGDAGVRWPMVHVDDLADLYVRALEHAAGGTVLHGVAEEGVRVADLASAAAQAAGVAPGWVVEDEAAAAAEVGAGFAEALALDQVVSATQTRFALGWHPELPGAVTELASGSYRRTAVA